MNQIATRRKGKWCLVLVVASSFLPFPLFSVSLFLADDKMWHTKRAKENKWSVRAMLAFFLSNNQCSSTHFFFSRFLSLSLSLSLSPSFVLGGWEVSEQIKHKQERHKCFYYNSWENITDVNVTYTGLPNDSLHQWSLGSFVRWLLAILVGVKEGRMRERMRERMRKRERVSYLLYLPCMQIDIVESEKKKSKIDWRITSVRLEWQSSPFRFIQWHLEAILM